MENKVGNHIFQTHARFPEKLQFHSKSGEAKDQAHIKHLDIAEHVSKSGTYSSYFFLACVCGSQSWHCYLYDFIIQVWDLLLAVID